MSFEVSQLSVQETHKSSKKRLRSIVWDNFIEENDSQGNTTMKCKECSTKLSAYKNVLDRHWQTVHRDKMQTPKKILADDATKKEPVTRYRKITSAFAEVLSVPSIPINLFRNPVMRNFIHELNPSVEIASSFASLKKITDSRYEQVKTKVKSLIAKVPQRGSITADIWTDKGMKHSYLGFTFHYCQSEGTLQRIFLGLIEIKGSHTGVTIRSDTELMLSEFGLEIESMFKVVTDGASNTEDNYSFYDGEGDGDEELQEADLVVQSAFPLRLKCFAHTLQLVIVDMFKKFVTPNAAYSKMMVLVNYFGRSPLALQELKEKTGTGLVSPSKTRWSSQILVLECFLKNEQAVAAIARQKEIDTLTRYELQVGSLRVQAEKTVTVSLGYGYVKIIYKSLIKFKESFPAFSELADGLKEIMDKRFECFMDVYSVKFDPILFIAAVLDPNTAYQLTEDDFDTALSSIKNMIQIHQPESREILPENRLLNSTLDQLMAEYAEEQTSRRKLREKDGGDAWLKQILQRVVGMNPFGKSKIDTLKYWSNLVDTDARPVALLALEVLSVPLSGAPVERIFSMAGLATSRHRNRTNFDLLNSQLFIYCNRHI